MRCERVGTRASLTLHAFGLGAQVLGSGFRISGSGSGGTADLVDGAGVGEGILLGGSLGEEESLEALALRGDAEVGEAVGLDVVALGLVEAFALHTLLEHLDNLERRRVITHGHLHHLPSPGTASTLCHAKRVILCFSLLFFGVKRLAFAGERV